MTDTRLFTPRHHETGERLRMQVTRSDLSRMADEDWTTITDQSTGERWEARRADCGAECRCDAEVKPSLRIV